MAGRGREVGGEEGAEKGVEKGVERVGVAEGGVVRRGEVETDGGSVEVVGVVSVVVATMARLQMWRTHAIFPPSPSLP